MDITNAFRQTCPAVSVIIPMYNVEKYIGECLDSILAQTFQNFEVIVVDDCSTDNSAAIVQSYASKFGGRLILTYMKKNSGDAGFPRNKGIELSRGEYLSFIDSDDTITPTALEELYALAKKFDADVIHCEKFCKSSDELHGDSAIKKNPKPYSWLTKEKIFVTQPVFLPKDFEKRIVDFSKRWLPWNVCLQLIRRNFIIENEIKFTQAYGEDMLFTICELCCAERYVVVPNFFYYYRKREGSTTNENLNVPKSIHKFLTTLKNGMNCLDEFFSKHEFFLHRANLRYILFEMFIYEILTKLNGIYAQIPAPALDELLRKEFNDGDNTALTAFMFSAMNIQRLQLMQAQRRIFEFETKLNGRR